MISLNELVPVPIESFRRVTRDISFDVYLRLSDENVAHVFSKTTGLDYKRLAGYIQRGVAQLWIRQEDEAAYHAFVSKTALSIFEDPDTPQEKKIATLLNMTEQNMAEIFSQVPVREETATDAKRLMRSYVDLMTSSPQSLALILRLVSHGEYLYYHSIAVSIFSLFIAKATGQFDSRMLELVGLGGFLHDIGCAQLPRELLESQKEYDAEQQRIFEDHPRLGLNVLHDSPRIPQEVRYIVYQHHEEPGGRGFPNHLIRSRIYYPARVVAVGDAFSALISKLPYRPAATPEQAIRILQASGRHDRELVTVLASIILRSGAGEQVA